MPMISGQRHLRWMDALLVGCPLEMGSLPLQPQLPAKEGVMASPVTVGLLSEVLLEVRQRSAVSSEPVQIP